MRSGILHVCQFAVAVLALSSSLFAGPSAAPTTAPEPATFWLIGAGAGGILLLRKLRAKK